MNNIELSYKSIRGNVKYWYSDIGADKTLIFLHGLTADHRLFEKQTEFFADKYNCLIWDAPAHGDSRPYTDFTYPGAAEDLLGIMDECGIEKAFLIGQSMGGYVAQSFILRYPERVEAFVSIDSTPYGDKYYSKSDRWWLRQIEWMSKLYPEKLLKKSVAIQCTAQQRSRNNMMRMLECYAKAELCRLMGLGYAGFLDDSREMTIECPVLLIVGKKDITGKVKAYNKMWEDECGYEIHWIKDAAHNSNDDQPEIVNELIDQFVRQLNGREHHE